MRMNVGGRLAMLSLLCFPLLGGLGKTQESVPIFEIQGRGARSPWQNRRIETDGIVTLIVRDQSMYWIQDSLGDGNAKTSDGIAVKNVHEQEVAVGDWVEVVARVEELQFSSSLPVTQLVPLEPVRVLESEDLVPEPVVLPSAPTSSFPNAIEFWECFEGMRVQLNQAVVVGPTSRFGEFAVLLASQATSDTGFDETAQLLLLRALEGNQVDYNPERILIDDDALQKPWDVRPGDGVEHLVGVVHYAYGHYSILAESAELQIKELPTHPIRLAHDRPGNFSIATFNVENLFDTHDDPAKDDERSTPTPEDLEIKLAKLTLAIDVELGSPEIILAQEVENQSILTTLAERINQRLDCHYRAVALGSSDGRGIENAFLFNSDKVTFESAHLLSSRAAEDAFGANSRSSGREPLVGVFTVGSEDVTIVVNHFKSKGGDDSLFGTRQPPERPTERQRKQQAYAVRQFVNERLAENPNANIIVAGDLNDFPFPEPGEGDDAVTILRGQEDEVPLHPALAIVPIANRYTYLYQGNAQILDHVLLSPAALEKLVETEVQHINATFPASLSQIAETPFRCSDHDPIECRFNWPQQSTAE